MPLSHAVTDMNSGLVFQYEKEPALRIFDRTARFYGFNNFAICSFPLHMDQPSPLALSRDWPMDWCQQYLADGSYRDDPIMNYDRTFRPEIFNWQKVIKGFSHSPTASKIIDKRLQYGVGHGYSVPLPLPSGDHIAVHLASDHEIKLSEADLKVMVMAAQMLAGIFSAQLGKDKPLPEMTAMEKEILIWTSLGKSPSDTSKVMKLADHEIIFHLESARHKLGASNWTHAVVLALQQKLITL